MTKNNLQILDVDEENRGHFEKLHTKALTLCAKYDLVLDLATSDVNVFVLGTNNREVIKEIVDECFKGGQYSKERPKEWVIW